MPILESMLVSLAAKAVLFITEKVGTGALDKIKLENDLKQALISACDDLNREYPTIDRYIELFFSDEKPGAVRQESLLTALFSDDKSLEEVLIRRFQNDLAYRFAAFGTVESPPSEYSQIDFAGIRSKFQKDLKDDFIARSITEQFLNFLKEEIGKIKLPTEELAGKILDSQSKAHQKLDTISGYIEPFDYLTPEFFLHRLERYTNERDIGFYFGHEPQWKDITTGKDFRRELQHTVLSILENEPSRTILLPILGGFKSGKTTFLLRLAHDLVWHYGKDVLWLKTDHSGIIKGDQIENLYKSLGKPLYVFYDNIVDKNPDKWDEFINGVISREIPCYIITSMYAGQWDLRKAPPDKNIIFKDLRNREPYEIINTDKELGRFIEKVIEARIEGVLTVEETIKKVDVLLDSEGERFLNFIYYFSEDRSFKDSILRCVGNLETKNYRIYNGLVWIASFCQFGIYVPKGLIRKILDDEVESALVTNPISRKYVFLTDDRKSLYLLNRLAAQWIFDDYIERQGNGEFLEHRLGRLFDIEGLTKRESESIMSILGGFLGK